jgi:hypothetical protein
MFKLRRERIEKPLPFDPIARKEGMLNLIEKLDARYINNSTIGSSTKVPADNSSHTGATSVDKNWVHDSEILKNQWTNPDDPIAREGMATHQEYAKVICNKVAELLTRNEISIYYKPTAVIAKNKRQEHKPAMLFWRRFDMQAVLRKALSKVREQGLIIYCRNPRYRQSPMNEMYARILTMRQIHTIQDNIAGIAGMIQGVEVRYNSTISFTLQPQDYVLFDPNNTDNGMGLSELTAVWNKLLSLECIGTSLEIFLERLGNGFLHVDMPGGAPPAVKTYIKNAIKNVRSEMGILTESEGTEKVAMNMISPQSNAVFDQLLTHIKQDIAVGSELPLSIFTSENPDLTVLLPVLLSFANIYEVLVRKILKFEGIIDSLADVEVDLNIGRATLEIEINQAAIAANSVIAGKPWLSWNERRDADGGLPPVEGGDQIPGLIVPSAQPIEERIGTSNNSGFKSFSHDLNEKENETKPDQFEREQELKDRKVISVEHTEATDKDQFKDKQSKDESLINAGKKKEDSVLSLLGPMMKALTPKEIEDKIHVSKGTAQKIYDFFHTKEKDSAIKLDSYEYNGQRVKFSNAIMLAPTAELLYEDHVERMTPQEISKWFNDPNVTKELNLGIEYYPNHNGGQAEIKRAESVGTIRALIEKDGLVYAEGTIDMVKIDQMLGEDNWLKPLVEANQPLNLSAGMFVKEKWVTDAMCERQNLDVRSVMLVKEGRNSNTVIPK